MGRSDREVGGGQLFFPSTSSFSPLCLSLHLHLSLSLSLFAHFTQPPKTAKPTPPPPHQIFMGTFVVSFVGNGIVRSAQSTRLFTRLVKGSRLRRRVLVAGYFSLIVAACALFGVMTIPDIVREGADFVQRLKSDSIWVVVVSFDKISVLFFSPSVFEFFVERRKTSKSPSLSLSLSLSRLLLLSSNRRPKQPPQTARESARGSR